LNLPFVVVPPANKSPANREVGEAEKQTAAPH
jgi:hypothetical protein